MPEVREGPVPYTVRTLFNEETTVEREILEHLKAAKLGWTWRSREALKAQRPDEREVLLLPVLREKLKALNPTVLTDNARVAAIMARSPWSAAVLAADAMPDSSASASGVLRSSSRASRTPR
jgi:type I restriction enzyme R subunit